MCLSQSSVSSEISSPSNRVWSHPFSKKRPEHAHVRGLPEPPQAGKQVDLSVLIKKLPDHPGPLLYSYFY